MDERSFWYVAASSREVKADAPLACRILDERLVLFRSSDGKAACLRDRCVHRGAPLAGGRVRSGRLVCPYHGWTYDSLGRVVSIPSEGPGEPKSRNRCGSAFETLEVDGYVYVRLGSDAAASPPFRIPCLENPAYAHIRLVNRFENGVTNCVENFIDVPHTASVHPRIFRDARQERLAVRAERRAGSVRIEYRGERANFGIFSRFLNRKGAEIRHVDSFHMPNVTSVEYLFGPRRHFFITSQSVPTSADETLVFTDLTYDYGIWSWLARPIIRRQAQTVIDQDVAILARQMASIRRYGSKFQSSTADVVHLLVESIRDALARGEDPRLLPEKCVDLEMWV